MNILIAYLLGIMSAIIPQNVKRKTINSKTGDESTKPQPPADLKRVGVEIDLSEKEAHRYYGEQKKPYRLQHRIFWVNVFTLVVLGFYTLFTYRILCATKKSADAAKTSADTGKTELELSRRPWLSADFAVMGPLIIDKDGAHLTIQVAVVNFGQSPAVRGDDKIKMFGSFLNVPDPRKVRQEICQEAEGSSVNTQNTRNQYLKTWFPGKQVQTFKLRLSSDEIRRAGVDIPRSLFSGYPEKDKSYSIGIAYCVAYFPSFKEVQYHTGYVLDLFRYQTAPPGENLTFEPDNATIRVGLHYDPMASNGPEAN
jgi:hypothetical protein